MLDSGMADIQVIMNRRKNCGRRWIPSSFTESSDRRSSSTILKIGLESWISNQPVLLSNGTSTSMNFKGRLVSCTWRLWWSIAFFQEMSAIVAHRRFVLNARRPLALCAWFDAITVIPRATFHLAFHLGKEASQTNTRRESKQKVQTTRSPTVQLRN